MSENTPSPPRHKLAGFVFETFETPTHKQISTIFARFCEADQDPDNLPATAYNPALRKDWPVKYPALTAADIAEILTDGTGGAAKYGVKRELAETMDATQLTDILLYMKQARALYETGNSAGESFIPLSRLQPPVL